MNKHNSKLYSVRQVREMFLPGMSLRAIYDLIYQNELTAYKYNSKKWLIPESAIKEFIDRLIPHEPEQCGRGRRHPVSQVSDPG